MTQQKVHPLPGLKKMTNHCCAFNSMVYNNDYKMCIVHAHYLHAIRRSKRALVFKQENGFWVGLY